MKDKLLNLKDNRKPLISIIVVTYNSSGYVEETLNSILIQSYDNIELIVTDDYSSDNTVSICQKWLNSNRHRFARDILIEAKKNSGVTGNCNRGWKQCRGEWIKLIAGDDIIMKDGLQNLINGVFKIPEIPEILISQQIEFENREEIDLSQINPKTLEDRIYDPKTSALDQLKLLLGGQYLLGSAAFYKKSLLDRLNGFDEKYSMVEDFPFFVKFTFYGSKIHFLETPTILHRRHSNAATSKDKLVPGYIISINTVKLVYSKKIGNILLIINTLWHIFFNKIIILLGNKGKFMKYLFVFSYVFQPVNYFGIKYLFRKG